MLRICFSCVVLLLNNLGCQPVPAGATIQGPSTPDVDVVACSSSPPSYRNDVAPTLQRRCFTCHADGGSEAEDRNFSTFEGVYAHRKAMEGKVRARAMPPKGHTPLTDMERMQILTWLACSAPNN